MADAEQTWRRYRRNFQDYLKLEKGMASNSVDAYLRDVDHLMRFAIENDIEPEGVTLDYLQQLLKQLNDTGIAPTTQRRIIAGWRMFYKMLVIEIGRASCRERV